MKNLSGKFAVVTGAAKGIGAAIAERFLKEEAAGVAMFDLDAEAIENLAQKIDPDRKRTLPVECDVSVPNQVQAAMEQVIAKFGRIDILVNNAGITRDKIFHKMTVDDWNMVINVNLNSMFYTCKCVVPFMRAQQSGSIINISSTSKSGNPGQANYAASKAGIQGFTRTLAKELGAKNVRVNTLAPGYVRTDMYLAIPEENIQDALEHVIPMRRLGEPDEIAGVAAFLAGDDASFITGQTIYVCGGSYTT